MWDPRRLGFPRGWRFVFVSLLLIGLFPASAQPVPKLNSSPITWFQRGTTNEVTVSGEALSAVNAVLFTGAGVSGTVAPRPTPAVTLEGSAGGLTAGPESAKSLTVHLAVAPDAPLGTREIRIAGPDGVSNPLTLNISDLPELGERPADGPPVMLPAAISGIIGASTEVDTIRFSAKAGEKLIFDVQANRMGSPLDPTLVMLDSSGKELARSEDAHGLDPFIEFTVPSDGDYVARLSDLRFQGGGDYRYRLVAGALPYLEFLFPFGGRRGSAVDLELDGRLLEGSDRMSIRIASDAPLGRQDIRAHTARGLSNPQPFEAGDLPEMREVEPNNASDKAGAVTAPVVLNGKIGEPGDVDFFRLTSASDQKLVVDVQARRFGSPLDALLTLMDDQGTVLQRNDDAAGLDARIEFDAKKDAVYRLSLRDLTDRGGARFGYRMSVQSPDRSPDFTARTTAGRYRLARGGNTAVRCEVDRRNGFDGAVRIMGEGLPSGVTASPLVLGGGLNFGWLILSAGDDAPTGFFPLRLVASGEREGRAQTHAVQMPEQGWITVLPSAPFSLTVTPPAVIAEQNGGTELELSVTRRSGFEGEVRVVAEDLAGVSLAAVTLPPGQSRARMAVKPAYNAEVGLRPIMLRGDTGEGIAVQSSHAPVSVPLTTQGIPMFLTAMLPGSPFFRTDPVRLSAVALPTNSTSAANATEFVVKVDRRGMPGEIALALQDLPSGVIATVPPLPAEKNEATIRLLITDAAEAGKEFKFTVTGTATHNDRIWRQKTQPVTLLVAAPEKQTAAVTPPATPAAK